MPVGKAIDMQMQSRAGTFAESRADCGSNLTLQNRILREVLDADAVGVTLRDDEGDLLGRQAHGSQVQRAAGSIKRQVLGVVAADHHNRRTEAQLEGARDQIERVRELVAREHRGADLLGAQCGPDAGVGLRDGELSCAIDRSDGALQR